jgi:hypothetical protein
MPQIGHDSTDGRDPEAIFEGLVGTADPSLLETE